MDSSHPWAQIPSRHISFEASVWSEIFQEDPQLQVQMSFSPTETFLSVAMVKADSDPCRCRPSPIAHSLWPLNPHSPLGRVPLPLI